MFNNANTTVLILLFSFLISFAKPYKDEVIVFFKKGVFTQSISGLSVIKKSSNRVVIKLPKNEKMENFIKELKNRREIAYVTPNYIIKKQLIPNDEFYKYQWYLQNIDIENAWDISTGSNTVYVAVLDTGVDYNHPDLKNNIWLNTGETIGQDNNSNGLDDGCEDNIDNDNNGYIDDCYGFNAVLGKGSALDDDGHGTHVAGIIGAIGNNGIGIAGINWDIKIIPCKFLDSNGYGDLNELLTCLQYIKKLKNNGLNIITVNASYGYEANYTDLNIDCSKSKFADTEKCLLKSLGSLFTAAAGNGGNDFIGDNVDRIVFLPCAYSEILENVICVGSVNRYNQKSSFSNYGTKHVNIFAPGGEFNQNTNGCNPDTEILSTWEGSQYACAVGTSQAAPVVSGVAALLKSVNSNLNILEIKEKLLTTGNNVLSLTGYSQTCNIVNAYNTLADIKSPKICINKHLNKDVYGNYNYNFGNINKGETKIFTFRITSSGNENLQIGKISLINNTYLELINDNCSNKSLNSFENCSFEIKVNANTNNQDIEDTLTIPTNTSYGEITIKLNAMVINTNSNSNNNNKDNNNADSNKNKSGCFFGSSNSIIELFILLFILAVKRKLK